MKFRLIQHLLPKGNPKYVALNVSRLFQPTSCDQCPWSELDIEEEAYSVNPNAGLGNCSEREGYSGKVCFSGTVEVSNSKRVKVVLERCTLGSSCRLLRLFGSSKFLRLKIPLKILHSSDDLKLFFQRPFILWGSVFRSFYAKEGTVFLFQTNEVYKQGIIQNTTQGLTLFEFLDQFNPLELNSNQVCLALLSLRLADMISSRRYASGPPDLHSASQILFLVPLSTLPTWKKLTTEVRNSLRPKSPTKLTSFQCHPAKVI